MQLRFRNALKHWIIESRQVFVAEAEAYLPGFIEFNRIILIIYNNLPQQATVEQYSWASVYYTSKCQGIFNMLKTRVEMPPSYGKI